MAIRFGVIFIDNNKSGKIVGEKIIDNVFDINASLLFYHS
ncbi:hypothetical protein oki149_08480 [Helicobacter pylori]